MEIGADPSANLSAMGGLSAFCLACDKGDFRAVHIMLKKGMSEVHVQPGLNIAKKKHHHWVVGLLLYHSFLKCKYIGTHAELYPSVILVSACPYSKQYTLGKFRSWQPQSSLAL
jgi:hypothetical protein